MTDLDTKKIAADCRADLLQTIMERTGKSYEEVEEVFEEMVAGMTGGERVLSDLVTRSAFRALNRSFFLQSNCSAKKVAWYVTLELDGVVCNLGHEETVENAVRTALNLLNVRKQKTSPLAVPDA